MFVPSPERSCIKRSVAADTPTTTGKTRIVIADGELTVLRPVHVKWLIAITIVAAGLRCWRIGEWSLWIDEAHTWRDATMPLFGERGFLAEDRALYSLTFFLLRGLFALGLPETEGAMRLPFALLGIATVPLLGVAGRKLVGASASVLAAALLAVDPWHVYWSQNARGYVVVVLAAVLVANRMFAYVRRDRWRDLMLMWAAIVVATMSHSTGALLAFGFVAFLALRRQPLRPRRVLWLLLGGAAALLLVWGAIEYTGFFEDFLKSKATPSPTHFVQTVGYYFRPVVLVLAAIGLWLLWHFGGRDRVLLLGSLSAVSFGMLLLVGSTIVLVTARYAICVLPIVAWLAAFAAVHVGTAAGRAVVAPRPLRLAMLGALPLLPLGEHTLALVDYFTHQHGQRAPWREAAAFVRDRAGKRPIRVCTINHPTLLYYLRPGQWNYRVPAEFARNRIVPLQKWMIDEGKDEEKRRLFEPGAANYFAWNRDEAAAGGAYFAVMVTMPELIEQDVDHGIRDVLATQCQLVLHLPCWVGPKDESIYVYEWKQP